ncbi:hypothetical protein Y956_10971, partial [Nipponia nippon]
DGAGDGAGQPDGGHGHHGPLQRHDAVVAQGVEDGDVAVHGDDPQEGEGGQDGAADEHVDDVVHVVDDAGADHQHATLHQQHEDRLRQVADAHQHVGDGQAADEVVHGQVQVPVPQDGGHHQQVLHQAHQPQREEELVGDVEPLAPGAAGPGRGVALVALAGVPGLAQQAQGGQRRH